MSANVGFFDRLMRLALAIFLLYLGFGIYGGSPLGIGLAIASVIPALSAVVGICPLYGLLGIKTCRPS